MDLRWGCSWSLDSTFYFLLVYCLVLATRSTSTNHDFIVGSRNWWTVPNDTACDSFDHWAQRNRFQVGDSLLFLYDPREDSVLQVCEEDYRKCRTSEPLQSFKDGNTSFHLCRSGSYYFISGNSDRCQKSQKVHVIVMATRNNATVVNSSPPPAPAFVAPTAPPPPPLEWSNGSSPSSSAPPPPPLDWGNGSSPSPSVPPPPPVLGNWSSPSAPPPPPVLGNWSSPSVPPPPFKWGNGSSPSPSVPPPYEWGNGSSPSPSQPPSKWGNGSSPSPSSSPSVPPPGSSEWGNGTSPSPSPSITTIPSLGMLLATIRAQTNARMWEEVGGSSMTVLVAVVCYFFFM